MPTNTSVQLQYRIQRAIFQLNAMAERMRLSGFFDQLRVKLKKFDCLLYQLQLLHFLPITKSPMICKNQMKICKNINQTSLCAADDISFGRKQPKMHAEAYLSESILNFQYDQAQDHQNSKARQRLRQQKGLQPDFTTYVMGQSCEQPQVLPEFSQSPQTFFWDDWYIVLEEDVWEPDYNRNLFWVYQEQDQRIEKLEFQEQNSRLARLNEEIFPKMALFEPEQASISKKAKFQAVLRAKDFPKDSTPQQIHPLCEQLQRVRSQN